MKLPYAMRRQQTLMLEVSLVLGIVLSLVVGIIPQFNPILAKARLAEVFYLASTQRTDLMEQMALTGEGITDQALPHQLQAGGYVQENIEDYIGQKQTVAAQPPSAPAGAEGGKREGLAMDKDSLERLGKFEAMRVNHSIRVQGVIGSRQQAFFLTFNPSVVAEGPPANMIWLCGSRKPLPGWTTPLERAGTDLPPQHLSFICR